MKPAVILTDMLNDFIRDNGALPVGEEGLKIIPRIQELIRVCRQRAIPVVFANDALNPGDFLFRSIMRPHGIKGSPGVEIIEEIEKGPSDMIVHKPRFSAFFKTDLDVILRERGIDTIVVVGVATEICVLTTAYDGVCHDFETIVLSDCCASKQRKTHERVIDILRQTMLRPLLRVMTLDEFAEMLERDR